LAPPKEAELWSPTNLREKLVQIGAKVVLAVPKELFRKILSLIDDLRPRSAPA
jgi:hypothetical protein